MTRANSLKVPAPSRVLAPVLVRLTVLLLTGLLAGCGYTNVRSQAYPPQVMQGYPIGGYSPPAGFPYGAPPGGTPAYGAVPPIGAVDPTAPVEGAPLPPLDPASPAAPDAGQAAGDQTGATTGATPAPANTTPATPPSGKTTVAVLLPLSGANAALGRAFLDAAQLALFDLGDRNLALLPRDTASTPDGAQKAATSAIADGAQLIIGPIVANEVAVVKPIAQAAHVNVIAFSTATQYAGDGTWLMGFLPQQDVQRVVSYAAQQGITHFAALTPGNAYGRLVTDALRAAAAQANATVDTTQSYDPASTDVSGPVKALAAAGGFDGLLLPDGGARLRTVAAQLQPNGIDPAQVRILGSGLWDEPGLGQEPSLVGGWYAAPTPAARSTFEQHFQATYHRKPPRLATLAYDATGIAAVLARSSPVDFSAGALTNPSGFAGADGIVRLMPDGTNQRGLAVLEVTATGTRTVDAAPQTFAPSGQ